LHEQKLKDMIIETVIEVQQYVDFDVLNTKCIMVSPTKHHKTSLLEEFYEHYGIISYNGHKSEDLSFYTDAFISFLEMKGFTILNTDKIYFCD
jgi:hypothetical protein